MQKLKEMLIKHEGLKLKPYLCTAGKLTIGVGRNIEDRGISLTTALQMLDEDIEICVAELIKNFPRYITLSENRKMVLIDMCFNLGWPRLRGFKKMFAALEVEDYNEAANQMLDSNWAKQVGQRAKTLEAMMRQG
jgi:lysozyme